MGLRGRRGARGQAGGWRPNRKQAHLVNDQAIELAVLEDDLEVFEEEFATERFGRGVQYPQPGVARRDVLRDLSSDEM